MDDDHRLGLIAARAGRFSEAEELLKRAAQRDPNNASLHSDLGNVLHEMKRDDEAIVHFDEALANDAGCIPALCGRSIILQSAGKQDEALALIERAITASPHNPIYLTNRAILLHLLRRDREALSSVEGALSASPGYLPALETRAEILRELGRRDEAAAADAKALTTDIEDTLRKLKDGGWTG